MGNKAWTARLDEPAARAALRAGARSAALLIALVLLPILFFFMAAMPGLTEAGSMMFYNLCYSVFPGADTRATTASWATMFAGYSAPAPLATWGIVALAFGWITRGTSTARAAAIGTVAVFAMIVMFRLFFAWMGWPLLVDAL